jgi:phenylpropionate dioxygenase-like ring-hydroxylating dioxygenase large terminal subunit
MARSMPSLYCYDVAYLALVLLLILSCCSMVADGFDCSRVRIRASGSNRNIPSVVSMRTRTRLFQVAPSSTSLPEISDKDNDDDMEHKSQQMGAWVPVGSLSCLKGLDPLEIEIMGHKFAVWKSAKSVWSVLANECPHRMAPLSLGRVDPLTDCLECPYHGWQFDGGGTLQRIPQLEATAPLQAESRSVQSFPVHTTGDLLWAFLPTSFHGESYPKSLLPEDYYQGLGKFVDQGASFYTQDLPFSYDFLIEK